ncbi:MAG: recombinase family protein [bacterium]|nr:recombinase family protein [bacterium]
MMCYKVDKLRPSLLDFARHCVLFMSATWSINTADSSGRLMLNVLLSFYQFEREMTSDRTRYKMAATRKKGKLTGGFPVLGTTPTPMAGNSWSTRMRPRPSGRYSPSTWTSAPSRRRPWS